MLLALTLVLLAATPVTKKNWRSHPEIAAIRTAVSDIQTAVDRKELQHESRPGCEAPAFVIERDAYREPSGRIRMYVSEGGSDDSAYKLQLYYRKDGSRLFAYARAGAVNDSVVETRIYFRTDGSELWRDVKRTGPGYPFVGTFPDAFLAKDPEVPLKEKFDCPLSQ